MTTRLTILLAACWLALAGAASACNLAAVAGSNQEIQPERHYDPKLLDAAVRAEVNYYRCRSGLPALQGMEALREAAADHSRWMAQHQTMSHVSQVPGKRTLKQRLEATGIAFRAGAENLATTYNYRLGGQTFWPGKKACEFRDANGKLIGRNSYASLARLVVNEWINSPPHRRNLLNRAVGYVGTAAAFAARAPYCGSYYVTQEFGG